MQYKKLEGQSNYWKAAMLGTIFLFMFSSFNSAANLIGFLYKEANYNDLGVISLFSLYAAFGFSSLFAPNISALFNPKYVMFFSSFGYTLYMSCGIIVYQCKEHGTQDGVCSKGILYTIVNFCAIINGICASTLWVSQPWYITSISTNETRGKYFGIFWALMQSSQIVGNVMGLVLVQLSPLLYFLVMTIVCGVSGCCFLFLPSKFEKAQEVKSVKEKIRGICIIISSRKMRPMLLYYYFAGTIVAFYTGFLYKLIAASQPEDQSQDETTKKQAYVFIILGVFEFISGICSGYISDRVNRYMVATTSTIIVELALIVSIISYYTDSYVLCFISGALWGTSDCLVSNMTMVITTTLFPDQIEAFAIRAIMTSFATSVMLIFSIVIPNQIIYLLIVVLVELLTNISTSKLGIINEKPDEIKL
ncbi:unnamed protein product [Paramecium primaurelia]|uniref:Uncharacterized protein n=1 Tax=Paramecium primaurelia TaxID=5886 RepID=A0A8S1K4Q0_PARPR|nr:unnamed protein product [Paramecium primaurelia]